MNDLVLTRAEWLSTLWSIRLEYKWRARDIETRLPFEAWLRVRDALLSSWDECLPWGDFSKRFLAPRRPVERRSQPHPTVETFGACGALPGASGAPSTQDQRQDPT